MVSCRGRTVLPPAAVRTRRYREAVENHRENGSVRWRVIAPLLGRLDALAAMDGLAAMLAFARYCDQILLLSAFEGEDGAGRAMAWRIGRPLLFGRLWEELGIGEVLTEQLRGRAFEFAVERAVFAAVLYRLFVSGSDRDCASWRQDYVIPGAEDLVLHQFYCAMAWLGEELPEASQAARTLATRCIKDEVEEALSAGGAISSASSRWCSFSAVAILSAGVG